MPKTKNKRSRSILLTGGTGFLGEYLTRFLLEDGHHVTLLTRHPRQSKTPNLAYLEADLCKENLGLPRMNTPVSFDTVIHAAALYDFKASPSATYLNNVVGTHNLLHFCSQLPKLKEFHLISSIAIAGDYAGFFTEAMFDVNQKFSDSYAESKFAAEAAVRNWPQQHKVHKVIHRYGILSGDSQSGFISKVDGFYYAMRLFIQGSKFLPLIKISNLLPLPFSEETRVYMIPVDSAAKASQLILNRPVATDSALEVFHIVGDSDGLSAREILREIADQFGVRAHILPIPLNFVLKKIMGLCQIPEESLAYMYSKVKFQNNNFRKMFPSVVWPEFRSYSEVMCQFAQKQLFKQGLTKTKIS